MNITSSTLDQAARDDDSTRLPELSFFQRLAYLVKISKEETFLVLKELVSTNNYGYLFILYKTGIPYHRRRYPLPART